MLTFSINPETIGSKSSSKRMLANENQPSVISPPSGSDLDVSLPLDTGESYYPGKHNAAANGINVSTVKDQI